MSNLMREFMNTVAPKPYFILFTETPNARYAELVIVPTTNDTV
jgi:hypothetical protein